MGVVLEIKYQENPKMNSKLELSPVGPELKLWKSSFVVFHFTPSPHLGSLSYVCEIPLLKHCSPVWFPFALFHLDHWDTCATLSGDSKPHRPRQNSNSLFTAESVVHPDLWDIHYTCQSSKEAEPWAGVHGGSPESGQLGNSFLMDTVGCINNNGHEIFGPHFGVGSFPVASHVAPLNTL